MAGPINIHGKQYWPVSERVRMGHDAEDALQSIITDPVQTFEDGGVVFRAVVTFQSGRVFTGHAYESPKSKGIAGQAPWEVAETSAVGRALGLAGFGSDDGIASTDEVQAKTQPARPVSSAQPPKPAAPVIIEQTQNQPASDPRAEYARLFGKAQGLGIELTKDGRALPPQMPAKATDAQVAAAVEYIRALVVQAEDMQPA